MADADFCHGSRSQYRDFSDHRRKFLSSTARVEDDDPETMHYYHAPYDRVAVGQWIERDRQRYRDDGVGLWAMLLKHTPLKSNSGDAKIPDLTASGSAASTRAGAPAPHELIGVGCPTASIPSKKRQSHRD